VDGPAPEPQIEPDPLESDDSQVVLAADSEDRLKVQFFSELLESEGIPHLTRHPGGYGRLTAPGMYLAAPNASSPSGAIRVFVAPEDLDRAKELWESLQGQELSDDEFTGEEEK
jgi:hypothetical protein